jgi:rubrerythrin
MNKVLLSLNFMYCMERFATQIYRTQKPAFDNPVAQQLIGASENEREHVNKLHTQIKKLNGRVYPFGLLFQLVGVILGLITRISGKRNILKADIFVEKRAVHDYNGFLKAVRFDKDTAKLIKKIIKEEELHINKWRKARESLTK